ncbi:MAG: transposase [Nitrospira sp.]|nr:transposase [Nitrospira sp.]
MAKRIQRHSFAVLTYLLHGTTNAGVRAVKATIEWLKKTAHGFRNVEQFKIARYFHYRGLDL